MSRIKSWFTFQRFIAIWPWLLIVGTALWAGLAIVAMVLGWPLFTIIQFWADALIYAGIYALFRAGKRFLQDGKRAYGEAQEFYENARQLYENAKSADAAAMELAKELRAFHDRQRQILQNMVFNSGSQN